VAKVVFLDQIEPLILTVRDQKVMLDSDLAALYGVTTKRLNEQAKRNHERFPDDFRRKPDKMALHGHFGMVFATGATMGQRSANLRRRE
jgi:hypothetical protein